MAPQAVHGKLRDAIDRYVGSDVFGDDVREASLQQVVEALGAQEIELLDLVVLLEKPLSDAHQPTQRRMACRLLSDSLGSSADLRLNGKHIQTLATFFCSKLGDWQGIEGGVAGIQVLLQRHASVLRTLSAEGGDAGEASEPLSVHMARRFFADVHTPSHAQGVRKSVLDVCNLFLEEWRDSLCLLGEALGAGVSAMIEEERDPRNLMLTFAAAKRLLSDYPPACCSGSALSSIFETLSSYFPITFTPPKDDKIGITGHDLRSALNRAFGSTPRLAEQVIPFLLDAVQHINNAEADDIKQALESTAHCLERYGPETARLYAGKLLKLARDQVCRTDTPCKGEFADCLRRGLRASLADVPIGLYPHWLSKDVDPELQTLGADSRRGVASLSCMNSRHLLLAAAAANPLLLERVWGLAVGPLALQEGSTPDEGLVAALPLEAAGFVCDAARLAQAQGAGGKPVLAEWQLAGVLASALAALRELPAAESPRAPPTFRLLGCLCCLAGERVPAVLEAFAALRQVLLPPQAGGDAWATALRAQLGELPEDSPSVKALLDAVSEVAEAQPTRAAELANSLLPLAGRQLQQLPAWLQNSIPQLLAVSAMSLARTAARSPGGAEARVVRDLLARTASYVLEPAGHGGDAPSSGRAVDTMLALARALEGDALTLDAASWGAEQLLVALRLPAQLAALGEAVGCKLHGAATDGLTASTKAVRRLAQALGSRLPPAEAAALRRQIFTSASTADAGSCIGIGLLPAAVPAASPEEWPRCLSVLPTIRTYVSSDSHSAAEPLALEALEAIVEACPQAGVEEMLGSIRKQFGAAFAGRGEGAEASEHAAKGAVRSWAATTGALLRHGKLAKEAAAFLGTLFEAFDRDSPATPFVPLALQVLLPPQFSRGESSKPKLPPLSLQQLSSTTLPSLLERAKKGAKPGAEDAGGRAALESTVALLCALPVEVACGEYSDAMRWCTLTSLKRLKEAAAPLPASTSAATPARAGGSAGSTSDAGASVFAAQALQLLARACKKSAAWVEDNLHSVVMPLTVLSVEHPVPLVRLGSLQALHLLIDNSYGHLLQFKRPIEGALRRVVDDRRREVRLLAVACLNAWHCGAMGGG